MSLVKKIHPAIILFLIAILAYGLLTPQLGFYWDDMPMSWIRYELGPAAMTRYFSTNRPVWGLLYQITTRLIPQVPAYWQIFALIWRWLGAIAVWAIVRELWKDKPRFALGIALLFLLYPGFNQQWGSYLYSHFFIVVFFYFYSIYLSLKRKTIPALIFSALNLWMMEYFFPLEFARVGFFWVSLRDEYPNPRDRIKPTLRLWAPYLMLFALAVFSRLFIFNNQIYGFGLMSQLKSAPVATLLYLMQTIFTSLWTVTVAAWIQLFAAINPAVHGVRTITLYVVVTLIAFLIVLFSIFQQREDLKNKGTSFSALGLGLFLLPFAGAPFWSTGLSISLAHPASRFTLPFMFSSCLIIVGLIDLIKLPQVQYGLLALLIGLAAGRQFLWSTDYLRDWQAQKNLFWQMTWRAPGLKPGTLVLMNEQLSFYADNSISAPLNWIYAPDNRSDQIDYVLFYPTNRLDHSLPALKKDISIHYDYIAGRFNGNTSQAIAFYYDPPACLRLLEPDIDANNRFLLEDSHMREASALSNPDQILDSSEAVMPSIYYPEPAHGWCYYFEKADLARQFGKWDEVVALGDKALKLSDHPNNPVERFVFIEGYAHTGNWDQALKLSNESYKISKDYVGPLLCQLWKRIETDTTTGSESNSSKRSDVLAEAKNLFACNP